MPGWQSIGEPLNKEVTQLALTAKVLTDTQLRATAVPITFSELVSRMFNTVAAPGYIIQPSVVNTDYLYIMEAPAGAGVSTVGLRGIRVKLTSGSADFGTQYNLGATCTMTNYRTDAGWTS